MPKPSRQQEIREASAHYAATPPVAPPRLKAKLFQNGRSQAVRLPRACRLPGTEVYVHKEGSRVVLEPVADAARDANGWPVGLLKELARLREGLDLDEWELPADPPPPPAPPVDAD